MPKNLTDDDLLVIDTKIFDLLGLMQDATDKMEKLRADKLADLMRHAKTCAICAREAAQLSAMLLMQLHMQEQRAEIDRMRTEAAGGPK